MQGGTWVRGACHQTPLVQTHEHAGFAQPLGVVQVLAPISKLGGVEGFDVEIKPLDGVLIRLAPQQLFPRRLPRKDMLSKVLGRIAYALPTQGSLYK